LSSYTILVMEDNEDINLLTKATLSFKGYNVLTSFNGEDGLKLLDSNDVDLVLLDVMMPDMDGYQVLEKIKQHPEKCNVPVVFVSAKTQQDEIQRGIDMGAVRYITKPFNPMDFLKEIEEILNSYY